MPYCHDCKGTRADAAMTVAECGHETTRAGMKLCLACAKKQDACEACGEQLNPDPPPHTD